MNEDKPKPPLIVIHYSEIALKGKNRARFENQLINNIKEKIKNEEYESIEKKATRLILRIKKTADIEKLCEKLKNIFGIKWLSPAVSTEKNIDIIENEIAKIITTQKEKTIRIETKRVDKKFPLTSLEISKKIAQGLEKKGFKTEIKKADITIFVELLENEAIIAYKKIKGEDGLPVGSSGRVICLFSGGIDSPVAAWLMMKRGCHVDLLHIHGLSNSEKVKESKIEKIRKQLEEYNPKKIKLYLAPYDEFYANIGALPKKEEAVMFRRFIVMLANKIAQKEGYLGIVMGDNLGQVASQTLENMAAVDEVSKIPIYRPLLTMSKEEITNLAQKIGTYEISIEKYKDCCSLVAHKHPATKPNKNKITEIEKKIQIDKIVERTFEKIEFI